MKLTPTQQAKQTILNVYASEFEKAECLTRFRNLCAKRYDQLASIILATELEKYEKQVAWHFSNGGIKGNFYLEV